MIKKLLKFLNHERCQVIAVVLCVVVLLSGITCQSKTQSLHFPERKVTRAELKAEVETFVARADQAFADLDRQDEGKALLFDQVVLWTTSGTFNPNALLPLLAGILGVGAVADNVRKRKQIKKLNNVS